MTDPASTGDHVTEAPPPHARSVARVPAPPGLAASTCSLLPVNSEASAAGDTLPHALCRDPEPQLGRLSSPASTLLAIFSDAAPRLVFPSASSATQTSGDRPAFFRQRVVPEPSRAPLHPRLGDSPPSLRTSDAHILPGRGRRAWSPQPASRPRLFSAATAVGGPFFCSVPFSTSLNRGGVMKRLRLSI